MAPDEGATPREPFDEDRDRAGRPRPHYARTLEALAGMDLARLGRDIERTLAQRGVSFGTTPFVVDPVPRLLTREEWGDLERGLAQRTRALNAFLSDLYGERRILETDIVDAETLDGAEGYEPDLRGRVPPGTAPAPIIGFDLVRDPDGTFLVLEDNLRTPSGIAYLVAARAALAACLPPGLPRPAPVDPVIYELLGRTLRAAAPSGSGSDPLIVLLSDGPGNVAFYEHANLAGTLGIPLVTVGDLELADDVLSARIDGSAPRRVDVVYRRTDEDRVRGDDGAWTAIARLLVPPWLAGTIGLVNAFGNGVADDKLVHSHVEDFVRFYLDEEPVVRSVPTISLASPQAARDAIARLETLVIKPRHGHGGAGVMIGSHADAAGLALARRELERHPERYIAQPIVPLSRHPTVIDGRLEPRHLDLRPFAFAAGDDVSLAPGGLSRVAFDAGRDGRQLVAQRRRQGHLGARVGPVPVRSGRRGTSRWCARRPGALQGVAVARADPSRRRARMKRPVWTPPLRIAERMAARRSRRRRSRSSVLEGAGVAARG